MKDCIFCQIVAGKIPCHKVYEDDQFLGFLDINPRARGHVLVVPKKHYRWVDQVPNFGEFWRAAKKISEAIKEVLKPTLVSYLTFGIDVHHAHVQLIPRFETDGPEDGIMLGKAKKIPEQEMRKIGDKIRKRVKD